MGVFLSRSLSWRTDGKVEVDAENDDFLLSLLSRFESFYNADSEVLSKFIFYHPLQFETVLSPSQFTTFPDADKFVVEEGNLRVSSKEKNELLQLPLLQCDRSSGISLIRIFSFPYLLAHFKRLEPSDLRKDLRNLINVHKGITGTITGPPELEPTPPRLLPLDSVLSLGNTGNEPVAPATLQNFTDVVGSCLLALTEAVDSHNAAPAACSIALPASPPVLQAFVQRLQVRALLGHFEHEVESDELLKAKKMATKMTMGTLEREMELLRQFCGPEETFALRSIGWESDFVDPQTGVRAPPWREVLGELAYVVVQPHGSGVQIVLTCTPAGCYQNEGYIYSADSPVPKLGYGRLEGASTFSTLTSALRMLSTHFDQTIEKQQVPLPTAASLLAQAATTGQRRASTATSRDDPFSPNYQPTANQTPRGLRRRPAGKQQSACPVDHGRPVDVTLPALSTSPTNPRLAPAGTTTLPPLRP
ncbi:hypothetical protein PAPYR_11333 [Paratrimastix pyriformis]|uniref:Uncharacterized protein n=1 Tax=Paratrimastix pyriformis TaxID=342808 RepID=A0ABQ8U3Z9_9EUKA|nr:hypothetical protein PAPYR_11333 [Paratrimastix pyriformis]